MMDTRRFRLINPTVRREAARVVMAAPDGHMCEIKPPVRNAIQNAKFHAMLADISNQYEFMCGKLDIEDTKRMMVDAFARVKAAMGEPLPGYGRTQPSLIGEGVVHLGIQTRRFSKPLMAEFITYLHAWAADHGVRFSDSAYVPRSYLDRREAL